ncbi:hypothetical protein JYK21_04745 [Ralstonia pickettii]|nr:hypothetical protein [Ralstonia pickettii]
MNTKLVYFLCISIALTGFIWLGPYFVWNESIIFRISILISFFTFLFYLLTTDFKIKMVDIVILIGFILTLIYFSLPGAEGKIGITLGYIVMIVFLLIPDKLKQNVFIYFSWFYALSLLPGIVLLLLSFVGFDFNYNIIESGSGRLHREYFGSVTLLSSIIEGSGFTRLQGMFDEPGVVGTFSALFLVGDRFRIKGNFKNIIILIGGLLSLSFAFMVIIIIYIILRLNIKSILSIGLFIIVLAVIIPTDSILIEKYVFDRFSIEDGRLEGDNRLVGNSTRQELSSFYSGDTKYLLFGMGNNASKENPNIIGDSWQFFFYNYGIFGLIMLWLGIFIYSVLKVRTNKYYCYLFIFTFLLSFYQRHDIINLHYMIIFFGGLINLQNLLPNKIQIGLTNNEEQSLLH